MVTRIWTKPETQAALRALKAAGYHSNRSQSGKYTITDDEGKVVFSALVGMRGYLVRHEEGLFKYAGETPVARVG